MPRLVAVLVVGILLVAAPARATSFTLSSINVNYNQPGIALNWTPLIGAPLTFDLTSVGQTVSAPLFGIGTPQSGLNWPSIVPHQISVGLNFTAPPPGFSGTGYGLTGAFWFFGNYGYVVWNNPVVLNFGSTGQLGVSLSHVTFGMPGSALVSATFQLLRANVTSSSSPPVQVPEPSSAFLLLAGGAILAMVRARVRQR